MTVTRHSATAEETEQLRIRLRHAQLEILPERGLDIARYRVGCTEVGLRRHPVTPHAAPPGATPQRWDASFVGGLLMTAGPDHVGPPRDGLDQHGRWTATPATSVSIHSVTDDTTEISGHLSFPALGIKVKRRISIATGGAKIVVDDRVLNMSTRPLQVPLLYHANVGAPFWGPGARMHSAGDYGVSATWLEGDYGTSTGRNRVLPGVDKVTIHSASGLCLAIRWSAGTLPAVHQWRSDKLSALGIEPANCLLDGSDALLMADPWLAAGAERRSWISFRISRLTPTLVERTPA